MNEIIQELEGIPLYHTIPVDLTTKMTECIMKKTNLGNDLLNFISKISCERSELINEFCNTPCDRVLEMVRKYVSKIVAFFLFYHENCEFQWDTKTVNWIGEITMVILNTSTCRLNDVKNKHNDDEVVYIINTNIGMIDKLIQVQSIIQNTVTDDVIFIRNIHIILQQYFLLKITENDAHVTTLFSLVHANEMLVSKIEQSDTMKKYIEIFTRFNSLIGNLKVNKNALMASVQAIPFELDQIDIGSFAINKTAQTPRVVQKEQIEDFKLIKTMLQLSKQTQKNEMNALNVIGLFFAIKSPNEQPEEISQWKDAIKNTGEHFDKFSNENEQLKKHFLEIFENLNSKFDDVAIKGGIIDPNFVEAVDKMFSKNQRAQWEFSDNCVLWKGKSDIIKTALSRNLSVEKVQICSIEAIENSYQKFITLSTHRNELFAKYVAMKNEFKKGKIVDTTKLKEDVRFVGNGLPQILDEWSHSIDEIKKLIYLPKYRNAEIEELYQLYLLSNELNESYNKCLKIFNDFSELAHSIEKNLQ
ncbi:hypothetical protein EIN_253580 [Entamoeba invadens IP1]|uniref:Uncharacterized protein n=1 Tax=Entamoeba invadens IP1 TaxID=370355 RepID=A0A0A1UGR6_ENTIV|nr:hypothetical protein EIN_253580 [Entamoeba invadens IP1]ELP95084.1 hypothetical protein EIN_253580 [Entamoeba invadens IP1]|eukprot:XP_004261855.1 hypothetical protein EIN_253580 [Entamoeba invadens IP1]